MAEQPKESSYPAHVYLLSPEIVQARDYSRLPTADIADIYFISPSDSGRYVIKPLLTDKEKQLRGQFKFIGGKKEPVPPISKGEAIKMAEKVREQYEQARLALRGGVFETLITVGHPIDTEGRLMEDRYGVFIIQADAQPVLDLLRVPAEKIRRAKDLTLAQLLGSDDPDLKRVGEFLATPETQQALREVILNLASSILHLYLPDLVWCGGSSANCGMVLNPNVGISQDGRFGFFDFLSPRFNHLTLTQMKEIIAYLETMDCLPIKRVKFSATETYKEEGKTEEYQRELFVFDNNYIGKIVHHLLANGKSQTEVFRILMNLSAIFGAHIDVSYLQLILPEIRINSLDIQYPHPKYPYVVRTEFKQILQNDMVYRIPPIEPSQLGNPNIKPGDVFDMDFEESLANESTVSRLLYEFNSLYGWLAKDPDQDQPSDWRRVLDPYIREERVSYRLGYKREGEAIESLSDFIRKVEKGEQPRQSYIPDPYLPPLKGRSPLTIPSQLQLKEVKEVKKEGASPSSSAAETPKPAEISKAERVVVSLDKDTPPAEIFRTAIRIITEGISIKVVNPKDWIPIRESLRKFLGSYGIRGINGNDYDLLNLLPYIDDVFSSRKVHDDPPFFSQLVGKISAFFNDPNISAILIEEKLVTKEQMEVIREKIKELNAKV